MKRSTNKGPRTTGRKVAIGIVLALAVLLSHPGPVGAATFTGPRLNLYVDAYGAFNLAVPGEAQGLFEDGPGPGISPGRAGIAIYADPVGGPVGIGQPAEFEPVSGPQVVLDTASARLVQTEFLVRTSDVEPSPVLAVTQLITQSKTEQVAVVGYQIDNAWGDNVAFRPYLLGDLTLDPADSASATWIPSPVPTMNVSSTTTARRMTMLLTLETPPTTWQFGGWADVAQGPPTSGDLYGPFDGSARVDPAFGLEWSDWWGATLAADESADLQIVYQFDPGAPPEPQRGVSGVAEPVSGTVLVKVPGGRYLPLASGQSIPVGSLVDSRRGTVRITTAKGAGVDQSAIFRSGVFRMQQRRGSALTTLRLVGPLAGCGGRISREGRTGALAHRSALRGRRLWGKGKGRFKVSGKRGSGSVRGTTWTVTDRCDGATVIQAIQGVVEARDQAKGPRFRKILRNGQRYVARPRR